MIVGPAATVMDALVLLDRDERRDGAVLDTNLQGEMVYSVANALQSRGVPFIFASGRDARTVPARHAGVVTCEVPVEPTWIAKALFG